MFPIQKPEETVQASSNPGYGNPFENALNGVWLGHALHPAVVTVPIGAWTVTAVLDMLESSGKDEYAAGADASLAIGLVGAAGSALTGIAQWYPMQEKSVKKMATDHAPREILPTEFTPVLAADNLPANQPTAAQTGDLKLVLVKQGEKIYALADRCSHYGGPLSEGTLEGNCMVCPWHGSRFRLTDGHNEDGPATFSQPCFETRVSDGQIEVRARPSLPQNR